MKLKQEKENKERIQKDLQKKKEIKLEQELLKRQEKEALAKKQRE